jgi:hypothetical protein
MIWGRNKPIMSKTARQAKEKQPAIKKEEVKGTVLGRMNSEWGMRVNTEPLFSKVHL